MARISYTGTGSPFQRLLNHSPEVSAAYWMLRTALAEGALPEKLRMLSFLAADLTNRCRY